MMTDEEFEQIEKELGLKLPEAYRKIVRDLPEDLHKWPPLPRETANRRLEDFLLDVDEVIEAQKAARRRLRRNFPEHGFVFGRTGENFWLIDTSTDDPRVHLVSASLKMLLAGKKNLAEHLERIKAKHQEAWAIERRRKEAGDAATLSPNELIDEARRMARPAVLLVKAGKEYAAVSQGTGIVPPPEGEWEHCVSIDARFLPDNPRKLRGVLSVYRSVEDNERIDQVGVVHDPEATLPRESDGHPLFAKRIECVPPMEALMKFGSKRIQAWLEANSFDPIDGYDPDRFADPAALNAYEKIVTSEHPFCADADGSAYTTADCFAMLGGWSWCFKWCYGTDEDYPWQLFDKALVLLTVHGKPWSEVFDDGKEFVTFSRIT
jgi:hypothetical protein